MAVLRQLARVNFYPKKIYFFELFELLFLGADFFDPDFEELFFGTLAPSFRASESPIAIACLRLVTFLLLFPLLSFPSCISCITFSTFLPAPFEYFAMF